MKSDCFKKRLLLISKAFMGIYSLFTILAMKIRINSFKVSFKIVKMLASVSFKSLCPRSQTILKTFSLFSNKFLITFSNNPKPANFGTRKKKILSLVKRFLKIYKKMHFFKESSK